MQDKHSLDKQGQPPAAGSLVADPLSLSSASKKGRRLFLWWLLFVVASLSWVAYAVSSVSTAVQDPASSVVNQYYAAIKNQDYVTAFRFVRGAKSLNGEYYTQTTFTQEGQQIDTAEGKVRNYSVICRISWPPRPAYGSSAFSMMIHVVYSRTDKIPQIRPFPKPT